MRRILLLFAMIMGLSFLAFSQTRTVTGSVLDETGAPVSYASVSVKGSNAGVSADENGKFSISANEGAVLVFSAAGYSTVEMTVKGNVVNAVLTKGETATIEEVVVTALGIRREKKALGYAVSEVKGEQLSNVNNQNVVNGLNGKVAGVQVISSGGAPGQASRIIIRGGAKSITGSNQPLFVIDGVPISNDDDGSGGSTEVEGVSTPNRVADINPDDIESMSILKGSAASVLYGNRGSNGVILITTKSGKGKSGLPVISFNSTVGWDNALKLPDFQTTFAQGANGIYSEGGSRSFGPRIQGQNVYSTAKGDSVTLRTYDPRADFLRTGLTVSNNLSVAQSKENTTFFISAGHSKQTSIVPNQDYNKANARFNINNQVTEKFNVGANISYARTWGNASDLGQSGSNPFFALFNMPVSWNIKDYGYVRDNGTQINFRGGSFDNPLWTVNKTFFNSAADRLIGSINTGYKIAPGIDLIYRLGLDQLNDDRKSFKDINTGSFPNGALTNEVVNRQQITSTLLLNINKKLNQDIGLSFTGGHDFNQRKVKSLGQSGTALILPGIAHMNNVSAFDPDIEFLSKRRLIGLFGDLKFDYKNYLFLGLTARNEWSSTLPKKNRSYFFPGVNTAFIFSDAFNIDKDVLSYGKIRVGFAQTARDPEPYQVINTYVVPGYTIAAGFGDGFVGGSAPLSFPFNGIAGYTVNNVINNPDLKAETTSEFEVGAELKFLGNRIGLDFTYFVNKNKNGIIPTDISPASGATKFVVNSGLTEVKGIEIGLNVIPIKTDNFSWESYITFNRNRSKVLETYPGVNQIYLGGFDGNPAIFAIKGQRYGSIVGSKYDRDANGNIYVDDDGFPLYLDGENLGYIEPDWTGGIRNTFTFKNISLDFLFDTRQGGYFYNGTEELLDFYGVTKKTETREDDYTFSGIKKSNGQANDVVLKRDANWWNFSQVNEEYVYENNWVKLREANLSYTLKFKPQNFVKQMTIGAYGRNLWLHTKVPHVDPESSSFGTGNGQGATRMAFPSTRSIGLNLKLVL